MTNITAAIPFKTCTNCGKVWNDRIEFILSKDLRIVGYQSNMFDIEKGLFLFNHVCDGCGSTIAIRISELTDLYIAPRDSESKYGTTDCELRCETENDLERCRENCRYAYVRDILQFFRVAE